MRVLQVVTLLTPDGAFGGPARVALNLSAELQRRGHDVTLAAAVLDFPEPPSELDGVRVRGFPARRLVPNGKFSGLSAPALAAWFRSAGQRFDIVHIHFARDLVVLPVALTARRLRIPYVLQTHGMVIPSRHPLAGPLDALFTRRVLRAATAVLYLTDQEQQQLTEVAGRRLPLIQLRNGVPEYHCNATHPAVPEVLYAARLQTRKQPLMFVEMAKRLLASNVAARFTLVGPDGGDGAAVLAAIGTESRIRWVGALPPEELPARIAAASVYVLPSVREPYPMAVLEAMAVGVPVVITDDCGLAPVVLRTGCGIVVSPNAIELASAVTTILEDEASAAEMGRCGGAVARAEFSMPVVAERLEQAYCQALVANP